MKTLIIAAATSAALLMGASSGFAATGPVQLTAPSHMTVSQGAPTGAFELAAGSTSEQFRCLDAKNGDGTSINPNVAFCAL